LNIVPKDIYNLTFTSDKFPYLTNFTIQISYDGGSTYINKNTVMTTAGTTLDVNIGLSTAELFTAVGTYFFRAYYNNQLIPCP